MALTTIGELYQRYKSGTNWVVTWLTTTAKTLACFDDALPGTKQGKKYSGKQQKSAKRVYLSTRDLTRLADAIAVAAKERCEPVEDIGNAAIVLQDIIAGRREFSQFRKQSDIAADSEATRPHEHFVGVLSHILARINETRCLHIAQFQHHESERGYLRQDEHNLHNAFSLLHLEELSNDTSHLAGKAKTNSPARKTVNHRKRPEPHYELKKTDSDAEFALWCYFKDCHATRLYLRTIWTDYRDGKASLTIATHITHNACTLFHHAVEQLDVEFRGVAAFETMANRLHMRLPGHGNDFDQAPISHESTELEQSATAQTDLLCTEAYRNITLLRRACQTAAHGKFAALSKLQSDPRTHPLYSTLGDVLRGLFKAPQEWLPLIQGRGADFFLAVVFRSWQTHLPVATSTVVFFQIQMDIINILGPPKGHELIVLLDVAAGMNGSINSITNRVEELWSHDTFGVRGIFEKSLQSPYWVAVNGTIDGVLKKVLDQNDSPQEAKMTVLKRQKFPGQTHNTAA